jgi:hypothetical protein
MNALLTDGSWSSRKVHVEASPDGQRRITSCSRLPGELLRRGKTDPNLLNRGPGPTYDVEVPAMSGFVRRLSTSWQTARQSTFRSESSSPAHLAGCMETDRERKKNSVLWCSAAPAPAVGDGVGRDVLQQPMQGSWLCVCHARPCCPPWLGLSVSHSRLRMSRDSGERGGRALDACCASAPRPALSSLVPSTFLAVPSAP